jgi:MoaA/NifB/PqqE/SkfB family radical SAM enzyme
MDIRTAVVHANAMMELHGLKAKGWALSLDNAKNRAGRCNYSTKTISLSRPLIQARDAAEVRNTVLHEIAHALTPGRGHDAVWRNKFITIGGDGKTRHSTVLPGRYKGTCPNGHVSYRHRMTKAVRAGASCGKCSPHKYDARYRLVWVDTASTVR